MRTRSAGSWRGARSDLHVEEHNALVRDMVVLEIAQQRRRHVLRIAREEHRGAGHARHPLEQLRQLRSGTATARNAVRSSRRPLRQIMNTANSTIASVSGTHAPSSEFGQIADEVD